MKQFNVRGSKAIKKCLLLSAILFSSLFSFAHRVELYTTGGCTTGSTLTVHGTAVFCSANSYFNYQYKDNSGIWKCFTSSSVINGTTFTVSGYSAANAGNNCPTLSVSNATTALEDVQVRVLIADGVYPCGSPSGTHIWDGDDQALSEVKMFRLHVYSNGSDCGATTPGCVGNVLTNSGGYYGGFENMVYLPASNAFTNNNFISGAGSTDYTAGGNNTTAPATSGTGTYQVLNNPYGMNSGNGKFAPKTGNFQLVINGSANIQRRAWFKTVSVVPGSVYNFSAWVARTQGSNAFNLKLTVNGTDIKTSAVSAMIGSWNQIIGTYTAPAGVTSVVISISDVSTAVERYFSLDDICFTLVFAAPAYNPDFNVTYINVPVPGNVNTNDQVPAGTAYGTPTPVSGNPAGGILTLNSNGTYSFVSPNTGVYVYNVPVCVPGQVGTCPTTLLTITVLSSTIINNPPVANTDIAATNLNTAVTLNTLANDRAGSTGVSLNPSSVTIISAPLHGTATVNSSNGAITYTPATGFTGKDILTYRVCDNNVPPLCATAVQIITVTAVTTVPNSTLAADDYAYTALNTAVSGNVKTNDSDPENNTQTVSPQTTTVAGKGTLVLSSTGAYTFTPVAGFTGPVEYIYTTCDNGVPQACAKATLHILVKPTADLPDLTPSIFNDGTTLIQNTSRDNVIRIFNIGPGPTTAPFIFTIPKMLPAFEITINPSETTESVFGGTPVSNSSFTVTDQATRYVITSKAGVVIPSGGYIDLGLKVKALGIKNSTGNLSIQIVFGTGGGETPYNNNSDNNLYSIN